jgi:hypothetical protein
MSAPSSAGSPVDPELIDDVEAYLDEKLAFFRAEGVRLSLHACRNDHVPVDRRHTFAQALPVGPADSDRDSDAPSVRCLALRRVHVRYAVPLVRSRGCSTQLSREAWLQSSATG